MAETQVTILNEHTISERIQTGLITPYEDVSVLNYLDCGDDRGLTTPMAANRRERHDDVMPGRLFGAACGLGIASLTSLVVSEGESSLKQFGRRISAETLADIGADIADKGHSLFGMDINQHSADGNEGSDSCFAEPKRVKGPLGCKYADAIGAVVQLAGSKEVVSEAHRINRLSGAGLDIGKTAEAFAVLGRRIQPSTSIHRGAVRFAVSKAGLYAPQTLVAGQHADNEITKVVFDMDGYASDAQAHIDADMPRYHHTPRLAADILPTIFPSFAEPGPVSAASLVLGAATRRALSGTEPHALGIEIIPATQAA